MDDELPDDGVDFLHMVRDLPSAPAAIYSAWLDLSRITSWWGAEGFVVPPDRIVANAHEGGNYQACMVHTATGDEMWWAGEYRVLEPPHRLEVTMQWRQADGTPAGPVRLISMALQPLPDLDGEALTRMTFRAGPFIGDRELRAHETGWGESFSRLAGYLARHGGRS
ncbi:SRPBCC domain-containing protein [Arthrobacter sp. YD2]|uniref:SRPBCC family protein n=1 Tax=Arthrobacter sp. YD2 TaxID=3058046 RepID=UPI0025B56AA8|nr:SRPBCC domain-containing protein [Arthrobacter sp. YD2]MDN3905432.1 SRPBCC domain-containing protein [Arthrobacter sp. YD2]